MTDNKQTQAEYWNGDRGETWARHHGFLDDMLRPVEGLLVEAVSRLHPHHVLDVGCGNGTTTLSIARSLAPNGRCTGIDLSQPMVEKARSRLSNDVPAHFICADAAEHHFEGPRFDALASRFGVMFFADSVAAFRNLRAAATDRAGLAVVVWRQPADDDFMVTAQHAAAPFLPEAPSPEPDAPGPFRFGDRDRVRSILHDSGWTSIDFEAVDLQCSFPATDLDMFVNNLARTGEQAGSLDEDTRSEMLGAVRAAYERFIDGDEVKFISPVWLISGRGDAA